MDTSQYLDVFIDESTEHMDTISNQLLELENNPKNKTIIDEIFRAAHTIKGMSATMGFQDIASLTHNLENAFDAIRYDKIEVNASIMDVLFDTVDALNTMLQDVLNGGDGTKNVAELNVLLEQIEKGEKLPSASLNESGQKSSARNSNHSITSIDEFELAIMEESIARAYKNYEITIQLNESCLLKGARVFMVFEVLDQLGEVIKSEPAVHELEEENFDFTFTVLFVTQYEPDEILQKINKVSEIEQTKMKVVDLDYYRQHSKQENINISPNKGAMEKPKAKTSIESSKQKQSTSRNTIRVNIDRLDMLMNLFEELVIDRGRLEQISEELKHNDLRETVERMARTSSDLQSVILTMRMVPVSQVFNRFPGMIRQISRDLNKDIAVEIIGADTELDRTVIDEIGDPLVHLIRNAVDHGVEFPEERINKGKNPQGTITLKAYHSGNHVFIEILDDGAGISKDKVLTKALENGVITAEEAEVYTDQQIYSLILASGFSTTKQVSDLSGRGVGLDVVKTTIEKLGGSISIDSKLNEGSIFSIQLPLTLSIISVLLVELQDEKYAIPLSSVIETVIVHQEELLNAHHKQVIDFRGKVIPLVFLNDFFNVEITKEQNKYYSVVIVKRGDKFAGLVVDSFIGQHEIVLKSLGNYLINTNAISGATILGDGEVALIIDTNALIK